MEIGLHELGAKPVGSAAQEAVVKAAQKTFST